MGMVEKGQALLDRWVLHGGCELLLLLLLSLLPPSPSATPNAVWCRGGDVPEGGEGAAHGGGDLGSQEGARLLPQVRSPTLPV